MNIKDLRTKSQIELQQELSKLSKQLFDSRMGLSLGKLKNSVVLKQLRRDVARVKTVLGENPDG